MSGLLHSPLQNYAISLKRPSSFRYFFNEASFFNRFLWFSEKNEESQTYFRNEYLCKAMVDLNMIDTVSRGIKKIFNEQLR